MFSSNSPMQALNFSFSSFLTASSLSECLNFCTTVCKSSSYRSALSLTRLASTLILATSSLRCYRSRSHIYRLSLIPFLISSSFLFHSFSKFLCRFSIFSISSTLLITVSYNLFLSCFNKRSSSFSEERWICSACFSLSSLIWSSNFSLSTLRLETCLLNSV